MHILLPEISVQVCPSLRNMIAFTYAVLQKRKKKKEEGEPCHGAPPDDSFFTAIGTVTIASVLVHLQEFLHEHEDLIDLSLLGLAAPVGVDVRGEVVENVTDQDEVVGVEEERGVLFYVLLHGKDVLDILADRCVAEGHVAEIEVVGGREVHRHRYSPAACAAFVLVRHCVPSFMRVLYWTHRRLCRSFQNFFWIRWEGLSEYVVPPCFDDV